MLKGQTLHQTKHLRALGVDLLPLLLPLPNSGSTGLISHAYHYFVSPVLLLLIPRTHNIPPSQLSWLSPPQKPKPNGLTIPFRLLPSLPLLPSSLFPLLLFLLFLFPPLISSTIPLDNCPSSSFYFLPLFHSLLRHSSATIRYSLQFTPHTRSESPQQPENHLAQTKITIRKFT